MKIEIGSKIKIGKEVWEVVEIDDNEIRLGLNGAIKIFKKGGE